MKKVLLFACLVGLVILNACKKDDEKEDLPNDISIMAPTSVEVYEKDTTVKVTFEFAVAARKSGTLVINAVADNLNYDERYTTDPVEVDGAIVVPFAAGDATVSFDINVLDDNSPVGDGSVTFTLVSIDGENVTVPAGETFTLVVKENDIPVIDIAEESADLAFGEVIPGTESDVKEIIFTGINIAGDVIITAPDGFMVSDAADGIFANTASLDGSGLDENTTASFYAKASIPAEQAYGLLEGTIQLSAGEVTADVAANAIVSNAIGVLFWSEFFEFYAGYDADAFLPWAGGRDYLAANQDDFSSWVNWALDERSAIAMGNDPLIFDGYPGSGTGRSIHLIDDGSEDRVKPNGEMQHHNSSMTRRFASDADAIKSGSVYFSGLINVDDTANTNFGTRYVENFIFELCYSSAQINANNIKLCMKGFPNGKIAFGLNKGSEADLQVYGDAMYDLDETYAIVIKYTFVEGGDYNDVAELYVFEPGQEIPMFEDGSATPYAMLDENTVDVGKDVDATSGGLNCLYFREKGDWTTWGGLSAIHESYITGFKVATSWYSLLNGEPLYSSEPEAELTNVKVDVSQGK